VDAIGIDKQERDEKEAFRVKVQGICREAIATYEMQEFNNAEFDKSSVKLQCYGSMGSGFATKGSDMDLALVSPSSTNPPDSLDSALPRLLEKTLLDQGFGARLLSRTRVPIIKLCEKPTHKLYEDLQAERRKWEEGFEPETDKVVENEDKPKKVADIDVDHHAEKTEEKEEEEEGEALALPKRSHARLTKYEARLACFHEHEKVSLQEYYGAAKRLLHELGGRDVPTNYNANQPTDQELRILSDVCYVFVHGLRDESLRQSVWRYRSMRLGEAEKRIKLRSLHGIHLLIEGEQLARAFESRPLQERTEFLENELAKMVSEWRELCDNYSDNDSYKVRRLKFLADKLKKSPTLRLATLQQDGHEPATAFFARVRGLLRDLGGEESKLDPHLQAIINNFYCMGLRDEMISKKLSNWLAKSKPVPLQVLALYHRILELAKTYQTLLDKDAYDGKSFADVLAYISLLHSALVTPFAPSMKPQPPLAVTPSTLYLVARIFDLGYPRKSRQDRDRYHDPLEFPKSLTGVQCDISCNASLAIQNTQLLRCYAACDKRVTPMVLFVKYWAKTRNINSAYRGCLSSYGYTLMVLHYLVNVAAPPVCPNLQSYYPPGSPDIKRPKPTTVQGMEVCFWNDEDDIKKYADHGLLTQNQQSLGELLRGFFEYYANTNIVSNGVKGLDWGRDVLSLRTRGGLLSKTSKGWVQAKVVMEKVHDIAPVKHQEGEVGIGSNEENDAKRGSVNLDDGPGAPTEVKVKEEVKKVNLRYLFAIEDPFEHDHNVARTVTHLGIVAIRDEFRRAWRIIKSAGITEEGGLLDEVENKESNPEEEFTELLRQIHGRDWEKATRKVRAKKQGAADTKKAGKAPSEASSTISATRSPVPLSEAWRLATPESRISSPGIGSPPLEVQTNVLPSESEPHISPSASPV
jgi:DNA polymerase sigma